ncbi:hypothetical protein [Nocardia sp. NPDC058497]|uniref:hypothetical protein n=1 Tax=Nocardia sp. NPDC058497 TaxID=3346529 RepID=UPI00366048BD
MMDDSMAALWVYDDVQSVPESLVRVVDAIARVSSATGGETEMERTGNAWHIAVNRKGASLENHYNPEIGIRCYTNDEILEVIHQYWNCMIEVGRKKSLDKAILKFSRKHHRMPEIPWSIE